MTPVRHLPSPPPVVAPSPAYRLAAAGLALLLGLGPTTAAAEVVSPDPSIGTTGPARGVGSSAPARSTTIQCYQDGTKILDETRNDAVAVRTDHRLLWSQSDETIFMVVAEGKTACVLHGAEKSRSSREER